MDAGPVLYDNKPVIMKQWTPEMDLLKEEIKVVPTWVRFPGLPLKYWGQTSLNKIASLVGKPIKTDRATAQKDCIEYAKVLVEVQMGQVFPDEIKFLNEKGSSCHKSDAGGVTVGVQDHQKRTSEVPSIREQEQALEAAQGQKEISVPGKEKSGAEAIVGGSSSQKDDVACKKVGKGHEKTIMLGVGVKEKVVDQQQGLFGLLETRVKTKNFSKVFPNVCKDWAVVTNYQFHAGGRIWFIWLPSVFVVNVCSCSSQYIHCEVLHRASGGVFEVAMVYGANDGEVREELWRDFVRLSKNVKEAWVVMGDFNSVLNLEERLGSAVTLREVEPFRWVDKFSNANVMFTLEGISDHCAGVLKLDSALSVKARPFKFCNMWAMDESFLNIVQHGWQERIEGAPMFRVVSKLKKSKQSLRNLHKNKFSQIENDAAIALIKLLEVQKDIHSDPQNGQR
ncbi:uncharacterized protein LOC104899352 [Beta vulgaris subsp. vulgaris]|uniref:uncharacterized protein LOC104899352 n=1 Tax=Beta vulgaris subsp. vulgaris TaxID=3555 RepID=UPI00254755E3|nr:uncharacterized protein LOC104899352 [Beta vulgaris subsp. vulgaris]